MMILAYFGTARYRRDLVMQIQVQLQRLTQQRTVGPRVPQQIMPSVANFSVKGPGYLPRYAMIYSWAAIESMLLTVHSCKGERGKTRNGEGPLENWEKVQVLWICRGGGVVTSRVIRDEYRI